MSHTYTLKFNLSTRDSEVALAAVQDVVRMIEDYRCIVVRQTTDQPFFGLISSAVVFHAASDAEAQDLTRRVKSLPGLPPMDSVYWLRVSR